MPTMSGLVDAYQQHIRPASLLDDVAWVSAVDRVQGSTGLDLLAGDVAARLDGLGLEVTLRRYRPGYRWWSFTAPAARSAVTASLDLIDPAEPVTSYPGQSCSLARGSASTAPRDIRVALLGADPRGALVLCPPQPRFALGALTAQLHAAGAVAIAIESPAGGHGGDVVARLELADGCPLVGFSLSPDQAAQLRARAGRLVRVTAVHDPAADIPIVHARHHGDFGGPRALLIAHLCHPAPSANDNGSGVAGLLAIAAAVNQLWPPDSGPNIDLLLVPEMVGTAAYLRDIALDGNGQQPSFVISLDMIGVGKQLAFEDAPDHSPAPIAAALLAAHRHVRSGRPRARALRTRVVPFVGASDHLLFADRSIAVPSAHVSCGPDTAHHTSYDTIARIDPGVLNDVTVTTAAAVSALGLGNAAIADIGPIHDVLTAQRLARIPDEPGAAAYRQVVSAAAAAEMAGWYSPSRSPGVLNPLPGMARDEQPIVRAWAGPWNLQNLTTALPAAQQAALAELLDPPGPGYARLVGLAHALDGATGLTSLLTRARWATGLDITADVATRFIGLMSEAGWVKTSD